MCVCKNSNITRIEASMHIVKWTYSKDHLPSKHILMTQFGCKCNGFQIILLIAVANLKFKCKIKQPYKPCYLNDMKNK